MSAPSNGGRHGHPGVRGRYGLLHRTCLHRTTPVWSGRDIFLPCMHLTANSSMTTMSRYGASERGRRALDVERARALWCYSRLTNIEFRSVLRFSLPSLRT